MLRHEIRWAFGPGRVQIPYKSFLVVVFNCLSLIVALPRGRGPAKEAPASGMRAALAGTPAPSAGAAGGSPSARPPPELTSAEPLREEGPSTAMRREMRKESGEMKREVANEKRGETRREIDLER